MADIGFLGCQVKNPETGKGNVDGVKIFLGGNIGHEAELGTEVDKVPFSTLTPLFSLSLIHFLSLRSEKDQKIVDRRDQMTGKMDE